MKKLFLILFAFGLTLFAQTSQKLIKENTLNVYVDCSGCDLDYLKEKIEFVNFVRDRKDADVHILFSSQVTGGGGKKVSLFFIGLNRFQNSNDTLFYITDKDDTEDTERSKMQRVIKLGLIKYVAKTPISENIDIKFIKSVESKEKEKVTDEWNFWVFNSKVNGFLNGSENTKYYFFYGNISASRVTEELKLNFRIYGNYNEQNFTYNDIVTKSIQRRYGFSAAVIKSITDHWSVGFWSGISSADFNNLKLSFRLSPGIEYNVFPYSLSNSKQFRIGYYLNGNRNEYYEETIYFKTKETLFNHSLKVSVNFIQPWGSIDISVSGSNYFHDFSKYSVNTNVDLNLRLIKGLSLNLRGGYSKVNDQLYLPKRGATKEEVLLQQRELETQYRFWGSIGFSYTFGSIYNNIVNPRFGNYF